MRNFIGAEHSTNTKKPSTTGLPAFARSAAEMQTKALLNMIDDIHANPVRRGLVSGGSGSKWSSAGWFAGQPLNDLEPDQIPWDWIG